MRDWLPRNRSLFCLLAGIILLGLSVMACSAGIKMAPVEPIYPYRGLNENTILGPR